MNHSFLAIDLGAESGRAMLGTLAEGTLELRELHRFPNRPSTVEGALRWDVPKLFSEIKAGIRLSCKDVDSPPLGIGVDTWGVDFGLLDARGELISNPVHYRDARTNGILERAFEIVPRHEIYMQTGIQFLQFNSIFQLLAMRLAGSAELESASEMLMMPDLFNAMLSGVRAREFTDATTTQAYHAIKGDWAWELIDAFKIPRKIFGPVTAPASRLGSLSAAIASELGVTSIPVLLPASHDTGSAVAAVPAEGVGWAYISCGTWALVGVETARPVINDQALAFNFTNEGGVFGTNRLLANVMGLWLLQRAKASWDSAGNELSYTQIVELAANARPFAGWIDADDQSFFNPPDMIAAIHEFAARTGQSFPKDPGSVARIIMESLALKYRFKLNQASALKGEAINTIHVVGGGSRNELLCQMTADACKCRVVAGPAEATAMGNVLVQACAAGLLSGLPDIRATVRNSCSLKTFDPNPSPEWDQMFDCLATQLANRD